MKNIQGRTFNKLKNIHGFWNPSTSLNFDTLKKFERKSMKIWLNIPDCWPFNQLKSELGSEHVATALCVMITAM